MTDRTPEPVDGRSATVLGGIFYAAVALIALAGQTGAAVRWLHWPVPAALGAVAALELGAVTLSAWADFRQRLGERAYPARTLSAAVAVFAVVIQWYGHPARIQAAFFAGMSALGYAVWLIQSAARRRDQLRAAGMLPPVPPAYGLVQWLTRPLLTRRARALALADPGLGLYGSLRGAREQVRAERRNRAIAASLRKMLTEGKDPLPAEIAVNVFDTDEIAKLIAAGADYDGLARLIAATLVPRRVLPAQPPTPRGTKPAEATTMPPATEPPAAAEATTTASSTPASHTARGNRAGNRGRRAVRNHGAAAINNARQLRLIYPHGITVSERQVRMRTGWQYKRTNAALAAYYDRADLTDQEGEPDRDSNRDAGSLREGTG